MAVDDFLADLKAGEIAEVVLLKPETTPEELNFSSVLDEDVLEEMKKRREARLGSEILKNPKDPVYPLVKEFVDVVSKDPPSRLPPDQDAKHGASYTIDLPKSMKTHPTFYVGRLKRYHDPRGPAAPQTPQASRKEEVPTPRNENQPQTSSNVQRRKAKTHAALVDREASGTLEGLRTVGPQLGEPNTHRSRTAESMAERSRKSSSPAAVPDREGHPGPVEAGGKPHPHRTRAPSDQPDDGVPRSPGPIGAGGPQA
ncbi:hypothetical protein PC113_g4563 [Phytophthora cactorum]|uniref:Pol protein n=1 Tax=Phytophthora cactorum TaxID=29920 RepID=A0A8T0ZQW0_9STRA|nr:hypothetical protein PC113_g4563 [Phytophthora cactorum]KAG3098034.1 hypothetical protein PC122_g4223 [Phytophthora cactorum]